MSREEPSVSQQQFKRCTYMQPIVCRAYEPIHIVAFSLPSESW